MTYPQRLLPTDADRLIETPNPAEHLIRWTRLEFPLKDETGNLSALAIEEKRLFHYSTNKIPRSEIEDVFIEFIEKSPFLDPWEQSMSALKIEETDFFRQEDRGFFFLKIGALQNHIGRYPFPADKAVFNCEFLVKVVHAPLRANFMHFELHIFDRDGNLLSDVQKKAWRKIIVAELRQHLIRIAKFDLKP